MFGAEDPHYYSLFVYLLTELNSLGLAYVHMVRACKL